MDKRIYVNTDADEITELNGFTIDKIDYSEKGTDIFITIDCHKVEDGNLIKKSVMLENPLVFMQTV